MDKKGELGFDARGLLRNEARLQADLRVASIPDGLDPDEIVERDREEWAGIIGKAKPIVTHVMDTLAADQDLKDPKVKNQIAAQVIPLIEDLPNPLERDTYRQALARMLRVDERALLGTQASVPRGRRPRRSTQQQVVEKSDAGVAVLSSSKKTEEYLIGVLFRKPELLYRLDRLLQEFGLTALDAQDFEYTDHKLLFGLIRESVEQYKTEHHEFVVDAMPDSLQVRSEELVKGAEKLDRVEERLLEELLRSAIKLRRVAAGENLNQLRFLQEEAHQEGDMRASSYTELVLQHTRLLRDLDQAYKQMSAKRLE
jgi:DNA primase